MCIDVIVYQKCLSFNKTNLWIYISNFSFSFIVGLHFMKSQTPWFRLTYSIAERKNNCLQRTIHVKNTKLYYKNKRWQER